MTTLTPNVSAQVEAHIAEFIRLDDAWGSIPVYEGQTSEDYALPMVAVVATNSEDIGYDTDCSWRKVTLQISILTSLFIPIADADGNTEALDPDAATNHADAAGLLASILQDYTVPTQGEDAFANVFGWEPAGIQEQQSDRHYQTSFTINVSAAPYFD